MVVSGRDYADARPDIVIMAVTSQIRLPLGYAEHTITDWAAAGLIKPSVLKPVFATIEQALVRRVLGHLTQPDRSQVRTLAATVIGARG